MPQMGWGVRTVARMGHMPRVAGVGVTAQTPTLGAASRVPTPFSEATRAPTSVAVVASAPTPCATASRAPTPPNATGITFCSGQIAGGHQIPN